MNGSHCEEHRDEAIPWRTGAPLRSSIAAIEFKNFVQSVAQAVDQFFSRRLLAIYTRHFRDPADPPVARLLDHRRVGSLHGVSKKRRNSFLLPAEVVFNQTQRPALLILVDRQRSNANARFFDHHDRAIGHCLLDHRQIREQ